MKAATSAALGQERRAAVVVAPKALNAAAAAALGQERRAAVVVAPKT